MIFPEHHTLQMVAALIYLCLPVLKRSKFSEIVLLSLLKLCAKRRCFCLEIILKCLNYHSLCVSVHDIASVCLGIVTTRYAYPSWESDHDRLDAIHSFQSLSYAEVPSECKRCKIIVYVPVVCVLSCVRSVSNVKGL